MDRKEVLTMLLGAAPIIHQTNVDKGFWEEGENRNKGEMMMLIVSELGEALDAHREGRHFGAAMMSSADSGILYETSRLGESEEMWNEIWCATFKQVAKDTVEDEIADTIIRLLDYMHAWKTRTSSDPYIKESTKNFGHDLLRVCHYLISSFDDQQDTYESSSRNFFYALKSLVALCDWYKIDIIKHVKWKMRYNSSRPHKHGKSY